MKVTKAPPRECTGRGEGTDTPDPRQASQKIRIFCLGAVDAPVYALCMEHAATMERPSVQAQRRTQLPRLWNVVLLDDDDHTYEYVIRLVQTLFGHTIEAALELAKTVDKTGRAICVTTHHELAELKVEQVRGFGADPLLASSVGPMRVLMEPADAPEGD